MARCKYCKKLLTAKPSSGTDHLKRHSNTCVNKHKKNNEPTQSTLQLNKDGSVSSWNYDPIVARESLARLIAIKDLPLGFGDCNSYEDHIRTFYYPNYKRVSRNTTRSDLIKVYENMRKDLITELTSLNFCIALTSDIWGANSKQDYLSVVAHYLDSRWIMQKRIIDFRVVDNKHTAEIIRDRILNVIEEYGIANYII